MIDISPVGLGAAAVANQLPLQATFIEKICKPYCVNSTIQPQANVSYTAGNAILTGTTLFIPVTAVMTIVTPRCGCNAGTQLFTETFYVSFQGIDAMPTAIAIASEGNIKGGADIVCGKARKFEIVDSLLVTITPAT